MEITVMLVVGVVVMYNTAVVSIPVARIITFAVVVWCNPASSLVRRSSPIALVPFVVISHWIPIAFHPHGCRFWPPGDNASHARRRRRPNHDANGNLGCARFRRNQEHCD